MLAALGSVRPISLVERTRLEALIDERAAAPITPRDDLIDLLPTGKRAFYSATLLAEPHVLTGSVVADRDKVVLSAWILRVDSASVDAVAVVTVPSARLSEGIEQLARRLVDQLNRKP